jgi:hypothetical protein
MRRCWIAAVVFAATAAVSAATEVLYVPASANAEGANQTRWRTDLEIKAEGDDDAVFTIELLESNRNNSDPAVIDGSVPAGQCLRMENLLETSFGFTGTAALRLTTSSGEILATSRTYNDDPGGTYGQTVSAIPGNRAVGLGGRATLIQLSRSSDPSTGFRTNIGFLNAVAESIDVETTLYLADGSSVGSITRNLRPFEHRQLNDVFHLAGVDHVVDGYAVVTTSTVSGGFIAYASVVDNGSGDAVFIAGASVADDPDIPGQRLVVFESFMRPG